MSYETSKIAQQYYNVSYETLRQWETNGKIKAQKTKGGHRRYYIPLRTNSNETQINVIYTRVSSYKQKSDLQNQIKFLQQKYPNHKLITDIGSGINFKRKGFISLLEQIIEHKIKEVVVANRDRLTRFGFDFFKYLFKKFGCKLKVVSEEKYNPSKELSEDILAITTVFAARYNGLRKYTKNKKNKNLSKQPTKNVI